MSRIRGTVVCDIRGSNRPAPKLGVRDGEQSEPFKLRISVDLEDMKFKGAGIADSKVRRDPSSIYEDIFAVVPRMAHSRRALSINLHPGALRVTGTCPRLTSLEGN